MGLRDWLVGLSDAKAKEAMAAWFRRYGLVSLAVLFLALYAASLYWRQAAIAEVLVALAAFAALFATGIKQERALRPDLLVAEAMADLCDTTNPGKWADGERRLLALGRPAVEELAALVSRRDPAPAGDVWDRCMKALSRFVHEARDRDVRMRAVHALERSPGRRAIELLIEALDLSDSPVAARAAVALGRLHGAGELRGVFAAPRPSLRKKAYAVLAIGIEDDDGARNVLAEIAGRVDPAIAPLARFLRANLSQGCSPSDFIDALDQFELQEELSPEVLEAVRSVKTVVQSEDG